MGVPGISGIMAGLSGAAAPSGSFAWVYKSADLTAQNITSATAIAFDTEVEDVGGWHDAPGNATTIIVAASGYYLIGAQLSLANHTSNERVRIEIYKNGSVLSPAVLVDDTTNSGAPMPQCWSGPVLLAASDSLTMRALVSSDSSVDVKAAGTWFAVEKVG